ncbi:hypothetical protein HY990_00855 [Candidatus Micrarchaeota archaeon]|nr:hypothetical protein [Candidatus Micrarchaeota archaeon]
MTDATMITGYLRGFDVGALSTIDPAFQWLPLCLGAAVLTITVYALIYGLSKSFNLSELERHSKSELLNAGATALIVIFIVFLVTQMETFVIGSVLCNGATCATLPCGGVSYEIRQLSTVFDVIQCRMSERAHSFADLQEQVTSAAILPTSLLNLNLGLVGTQVFSGYMVGSWYKEVETYRLLNHALSTFLISTNAMIVVAQYIKQNLLSFFLPIGLLLRSLYFTRGIGAFLISFALCFYFIFPIVYTLTDSNYIPPSYSAPPTPPEIKSQFCYPTFTGVVYSIYSSTSSASPSAGSNSISLDELRSSLSSVYISLLVQPFACFAITLVFVRYMTYIFGGEAQDVLRGVAKVV